MSYNIYLPVATSIDICRKYVDWNLTTTKRRDNARTKVDKLLTQYAETAWLTKKIAMTTENHELRGRIGDLVFFAKRYLNTNPPANYEEYICGKNGDWLFTAIKYVRNDLEKSIRAQFPELEDLPTNHTQADFSTPSEFLPNVDQWNYDEVTEEDIPIRATLQVTSALANAKTSEDRDQIMTTLVENMHKIKEEEAHPEH